MTVLGIAVFVFLLLWGFSPFRAIFPYLLMPLLFIMLAGAFLVLGISSSTGF